MTEHLLVFTPKIVIFLKKMCSNLNLLMKIFLFSANWEEKKSTVKPENVPIDLHKRSELVRKICSHSIQNDFLLIVNCHRLIKNCRRMPNNKI